MSKVSTYKKLMAAVRHDISKAKMKGKKVKSECSHKDHKGRYNIKGMKGKENVFVCRDCGTKLDFRDFAKMDGDREAIKKYIKGIFKQHRNLLNIAKIFHNKKEDGKILKYISEINFGDYRLEKYIIAMIADQFEPRRKNKKHRKNGKRNGKIVGGGRSLGGFK